MVVKWKKTGVGQYTIYVNGKKMGLEFSKSDAIEKSARYRRLIKEGYKPTKYGMQKKT